MLEANPVPNIEREQDFVEAPVIREQGLPTRVALNLRATPAANDASLRRARRRLRSLVWDDGGLKPFRVA
jgi:hypothetical protein